MKAAAFMRGMVFVATVALAAIVTGDGAPRPAPASTSGQAQGEGAGRGEEPCHVAPSRAQIAAMRGRIESAIETAFQKGFRQLAVGGVDLWTRIPFAENGERRDESNFGQVFSGGGKAAPDALWPEIEEALAGADFGAFLEAFASSREGPILFDLSTHGWSLGAAGLSGRAEKAPPLEAIATPPPEAPSPLAARLERPWAETGGGPSPAELRGAVYDYLYCVACVGMDCSGFVYYVQSSIAASLGADLDGLLAESLGLKPSQVRGSAGIHLFDPANGKAREVGDRIAGLRPGDIILFRGRGGVFRHSAVIESVDLAAGLLRYVQSTDWAPRDERGIHASILRFDPDDPEASLGDTSVQWAQAVRPAFPGEGEPSAWMDDGDRFRNEGSGWGEGIVVRLDAIRALVEAKAPGFYAAQPGTVRDAIPR